MSDQPSTPTPPEKLDDIERETTLARLKHFNGHRQRTADSLGISLSGLRHKLRKWGVEPPSKRCRR